MQCPQYVVCGRSTGGGRRGRFPPSCVNAVGRRPTGRRHTPPCRSADDDVGRRRGSTLRRQRSRGGRWRRMASRQFLASLQDLFYICSVEPKSSRACPTPTASCRTPAATALPPGASRRAGRRPDGGAASRRRRTTACRWPRPARTRPPSRTWATAPSVPKRPASSWIVSIREPKWRRLWETRPPSSNGGLSAAESARELDRRHGRGRRRPRRRNAPQAPGLSRFGSRLQWRSARDRPTRFPPICAMLWRAPVSKVKSRLETNEGRAVTPPRDSRRPRRKCCRSWRRRRRSPGTPRARRRRRA